MDRIHLRLYALRIENNTYWTRGVAARSCYASGVVDPTLWIRQWILATLSRLGISGSTAIQLTQKNRRDVGIPVHPNAWLSNRAESPNY